MTHSKCLFIRYTPHSLNLVNGENDKTFIGIPREDSAISLKGSYLQVDFDGIDRAVAHGWYVYGKYIGLANLSPFA